MSGDLFRIDTDEIQSFTTKNQTELRKLFNRAASVWDTGGGGVDELVELLDVDVASPLDGDVLTYDSSTETWINEASPVQATRLQGTVTSPANSEATPSNRVNWNNGSGVLVPLPDNATIAIKAFAIARSESGLAKTQTFVYIFKNSGGSVTGYPNPVSGDCYVDVLGETGTITWELSPFFSTGTFGLFANNSISAGEDVTWNVILDFSIASA